MIIFCLSINSHAQESVNTSGSDVSGVGGTVAYSIGQVVYNTNNSSSGSVHQGVQQAYEVFAVGLNEADINIEVTVHPNPTSNEIYLSIVDYNFYSISYELIGSESTIIYGGKVENILTPINVVDLPSGYYFINVFDQNAKINQSFQIIKR